jgi:hypothetical protein
VRAAAGSIGLRAVESLHSHPSSDHYVDVARVAPDALGREPIDWSKPVEGWLLW